GQDPRSVGCSRARTIGEIEVCVLCSTGDVLLFSSSEGLCLELGVILRLYIEDGHRESSTIGDDPLASLPIFDHVRNELAVSHESLSRPGCLKVGLLLAQDVLS